MKVTIRGATLYHGDAREVLPRLRRQIDAVVTGRRCVLIEREAGWFGDACRRLETAPRKLAA
jgi:hypothetical protein